MNNTFQFVNKALLNNSKAKQTHLFTKAQRFLKPRHPYCSESAYDLTKNTLVSTLQSRNSSLSKDQRFKFYGPNTPSPNAYNKKSFVDVNQSESKGITFRKQEKLADKSRKYLYPGPGNYQSEYNPEKKLSYTMRNRANFPDHRPKVGPGEYKVQHHYALSNPIQTISRYNNPKTMVVTRAQRFDNKALVTLGPGPFAYSRVKTEFSEKNSYAFGKVRKEPSYIQKNKNPAPNYYNKFSQFSELKGGLLRSHRTSIIREQ